MPKGIKVKVVTMGGEEREIETPDDILVGDFIHELRTALNLPVVSPEGRPIVWRLDNEDTGRTLNPDNSLASEGVVEGHRLDLIVSTVAGCFPESAKILLPSGEYALFGSIKPQDSILTFDPETSSYYSGEVKGVYLETYARQMVINGRLVTTPDQHLLLADGMWTTADHLAVGDVLLEFPFKRTAVEDLERREDLMPMLSLTLMEPLCFIVEGCIARDLIGKQEKLRRTVDVFLSHSNSDKDEARAIFDILEGKGLTVFLAERNIEAGQKWEGAIKDALKKCHNFWMLVTPDSLRSEWVITEWASAWALDKNIVPVLFRCGPEELPARLRAYQSVDFHMVERAADSLNRKG